MLSQNYQPRTFRHFSQQPGQHHLRTQHSDIDLSFDDFRDVNPSTPSLSSSPLSQYSLAAHGTFANLDPATPIATPRSTELLASALEEISANTVQSTDLMHGDSWLLSGQLTPKSTGRASHHRESSLSSLGSAGPASPFNQNTANPHIAVAEVNDGCHEFHGGHENWNYTIVPKIGATDHLYPEYHAYDPLSNPGRLAVYPTSQRSRLDRGPVSSHAGSVASSSIGDDSPATPSLGEPDDDRRRKAIFINPPKLDRTMTDIYNDELYSPNLIITSAEPSQAQAAISPPNDLFAQRLHAANSQHLSVAHSPTQIAHRGRSPFRQGSPLAPSMSHDFGAGLPSSQTHFKSARQIREQSKAQEDTRALQHHLAQHTEPETPKTISPKDAMLEFPESDGESNFPLFPQSEPCGLNAVQAGKLLPSAQPTMPVYPHTGQLDAHRSHQFPYIASQHAHAGIPALPQHYPFMPQQHPAHEASPRTNDSESASTASANSQTSALKPHGAAADGGTYTCTYHGCTRRFETPALLQRHKREGHRQAHGLGPVRRSEGAPAASMVANSQAGPHKCDRINPGTGKPCNTVFSRPYDLTRHEDTIHNVRKQKVRCEICTEEKTFSRADALTRHFRVCHPDMDFPGKQRRRGGS